MEKQELITTIRSAAARGIISRDETIHAFDSGRVLPGSSLDKDLQRIGKERRGIANVLYYIGGTVVVLGVVILIAMNWADFGKIGHIALTLGIAILLYISGVLVEHGDEKSKLGNALHFIAGVLLPFGLYITFDEFDIISGDPLGNVLISGILTLVYFFSVFLYRRTVFGLFSVVYSTMLYYSIINWIIVENSAPFDSIIEYSTLLLGIAFIFIGRGFAEGSMRRLTGLMYNLGTIAFLGAAFALGGYHNRYYPSSTADMFWEGIYLGLVFGWFFLTVYLRKVSMLVIAAIFMVAYIFKITAEYFADSLQWPVMLILGGFLIMGVGYLVYFLNKKYISQTEA